MRTSMKLLALVALCAAAAGCVRDNLEGGPGSPVHFGAKAEVSHITKTIYSGDLDVSNVERLDWENGDCIRIISNQVSAPSSKWFDYDLTLSGNENKFSYASADPHGAEHGLIWGTGDHTFYACYPAPSSASDLQVTTSGGSEFAEFIARIPADQSSSTTHTGRTEDYYGNMNLAYMTAAIKVPSGTEEVPLSFIPIVTTFYVTVVNTTGNPMTLRRVSLSSAANPLIGTYKAKISHVTDLDTSHDPWNYTHEYTFLDGSNNYVSTISRNDNNSTIYAAFSGGLTLAATGTGSSVTVALFAIPQDNITQLTLKVESDETGTISLPLKQDGNWISFTKEHKHNVSNVNVPPVTYNITVSPTVLEYDETGGAAQTFTVTSKKILGTGASQNEVAAPWKTQIKVDNTGVDANDWADMDASNRPAWLADPTTGATYPDFPLTNTPASTSELAKAFSRHVHEQPVVSHVDQLIAGKVKTIDGTYFVDNSTEANAIDLSYYDFVRRQMDSDDSGNPVRYTANCYVISKPGWYKFPCVYGNAIEANQDPVEASYKGYLLLANHLDRFKKMNDFSIYTRGAWLEKHGLTNYHETADLLWEKYTVWENGAAVTSTNKYSAGTTSGVVIKNISVSEDDGDGHGYVHFYVDPTTIRPGNAVITTRERLNSILTGEGHKITWSWHIWITDQDMGTAALKSGSNEYNILPVNLGWTDDKEGLHYNLREVSVRFINMADGAGRDTSDVLVIRQPERDLISTTGWQTYYQWGRKDPFTDGITKCESGDGLLYKAIKNPGTMYYEESTQNGTHYYDWTSANYNNLWDSKCRQYGNPSAAIPNHKTVYDPSPRRFSITPDLAFEDLETNGATNSTSDNGWFFRTATSPETVVFFPTAGYLAYSSADPVHVSASDEGQLWTYHAVDNTQGRISYSLYYDDNGVVNTATQVSQHRAAALGIRPMRYPEGNIAPINDGTSSTTINFGDQWGTTNQNNLNGSHINEGDITVSFSKDSYLNLDPQYAYDSSSGEGSVILFRGDDMTVTAGNGKKIVMIELAITNEGLGSITTDSNTYTYADLSGTWIHYDSAHPNDPAYNAIANYNVDPPTWTGGKTSVNFNASNGVLSNEAWHIAEVTVYYY